jgi:hypothetical protein
MREKTIETDGRKLLLDALNNNLLSCFVGRAERNSNSEERR